MIGQTLVFVCAAFGIAAANCGQQIALPFETSCLSGSFSTPLSASLSGAAVIASPAPSAALIASPAPSAALIASPAPSAALIASPASGAALIASPASGAFLSSGSLLGSSLGGISSGAALIGATNGPESGPLPVLQAPPVTVPTVESPLVSLSSPAIPAPRVIASKCICTKTVVKPQVYQRTITVPKIQRYLKRTVTPVVENVAYKSRPLCSGSSLSSIGASGAALISGSASGAAAIISRPATVVRSGSMIPISSSCGCN